MPAPKVPSLRMLYNRRDSLFERLAQRSPEETRDLQDTLELIKARENATDGDYSLVRSPKRAIQLCLSEANAFLSKQQIIDRLMSGGFVVSEVSGKYLLNDTLNYMLKRKDLVSIGDSQGWEMQLGLPGWESDTSKSK